MARVARIRPHSVDDPVIGEIFAGVAGVQSAVPDHFCIEMNCPEFLSAALGATQVLWQRDAMSLSEIKHAGVRLATDRLLAAPL